MNKKAIIIIIILFFSNTISFFLLLSSKKDKTEDFGEISIINSESSQIKLGDTVHLQIEFFKYCKYLKPIVTAFKETSEITDNGDYYTIDTIDYTKQPCIYYNFVPVKAGKHYFQGAIFINEIGSKEWIPFSWKYNVSN